MRRLWITSSKLYTEAKTGWNKAKIKVEKKHINRKRKFCPHVINKLWINYVNRISYPLLLITLWIKRKAIIHRAVQKIAAAVEKIRNAKNLRNCLTNRGFLNIIEAMFSNIYMIDNYKDTNWNRFGSVKRRCRKYEDDISAEKEIQIQGSRIPGKNEHSRRKKSIGCKKIKRKKKIISVGHIICGLSSYLRG